MDRRLYINALDYMLQYMNPPEPYRSAITAARNRFIDDEARENADKRSAYDWPYCSKCGKPYIGVATAFNDVRDVIPDCACGADIVFEGRPENNDWEYIGQEVTDWDQVVKAGGVEMVR